MATKTWDPNRNVLIFGGHRVQGFAEGTGVSIEVPGGFSKKTGLDGETTRSKLHDRSGTMTITLMATSESNAFLSALYAADRAAPNGAGIVPFTFQDLDGESIFSSAKSWVANDPTVTLDSEVGTREWTIDFSDHRVINAGAASV